MFLLAKGMSWRGVKINPGRGLIIYFITLSGKWRSRARSRVDRLLASRKVSRVGSAFGAGRLRDISYHLYSIG